MLLAAVLVMQVSAPAVSPGVGFAPGSGEPCVSMAGPRLEPGSVVTLIQPDPPHVLVTARIDGVVASCALEDAMVPGPYYRLRRFSRQPKTGTVWIAFRGQLSARSTRFGEVTLRLNDKYPNIRLRSCTSSEGLHLTVWAGQPLKSSRLWHTYYYLGYDVEPSCQDADTRGTG